MGRLMAAEDTEVFRAIIAIVRIGDRWRDGRFERTEIAGPFRRKSGASNAISRAKRENSSGWGETVTVTGVIESAAVTWERVE